MITEHDRRTVLDPPPDATPPRRSHGGRRRAAPSARAVVGGLLVAAAAVGSIAVASSGGEPATIPVVVASAPIEPGRPLGPENLEVAEMALPSQLVESTFDDPAALRGTVSRSRLEPGELLQDGDVVASTAAQRAAAPSRELSLRLDAHHAALGVELEDVVQIDVDAARRETLSRIVGVAAAAVGLGATGWALREGRQLSIKRIEVALSRLPPELDGTSIVQLTDVHIGPTIGHSFIQRMVTMVNDLSPDVIAITGDLVDGSVEALAEHAAPLADLRAKHGAFFVTGNHEYYSGARQWCAHLTSLGIRVLRNENVRIGNDEHHFHLGGIDDYQAAGFGNGHGPNLTQAVKDRDPTRALILLAHQPKAVIEAQTHHVDLQLSGHTHGGQLWPFNWLVKLQQPVVAGLERIGETFIYVSCGTGYWGPPMRLRAPAEITHITLRSAQPPPGEAHSAGSAV